MINDQKTKEFLISWTTPEFTYYQKSGGWFLTFGLIAAVFFITAIIMKNYFFALLVLIASFLIYIQAKKKPRKIKFTVSGEGIMIQENLYSFKELESFWIFEEPELRLLSLISKKALRPKISIPLGEQDPIKLKQLLINFLPERKQEETLSDIIARKIKF